MIIILQGVREKIKKLEDKLSDTQNGMSSVLQEIMRCSMSVDDQNIQIADLELTVKDMTTQLESVKR